MQHWRPESAVMTFDEVPMERSKSFVKALQELKNLRPQLYSAADYCEKSYLHNEQKQMVLDNLKDYAVRALVNAVDHLGTVAYKLTDLYDQQTTDLSAVDLKISCLNQCMLTCQSYMEKEGLREQQLSGRAPRHHKHYILPSFVGQKMQNIQLDAGQMHTQAKPRPHLPGTPASKTLSWHLSSENYPSSNGVPNASEDTPVSKSFKMPTKAFRLLEAEVAVTPMPLSRQFRSTSEAVPVNSFGMRDPTAVANPLSAVRSSENPRREASHPPARSKSVLSVFFPKPKSLKKKITYVS
ncbi:protein ABIL1 [Phalaenopsis equestris]|uniref:protein ABIL1 n=1 Tax=Phalaenopsis equestris TaxID=78828 RepID=UPI0009E51F3C|nr:protein ABIL1 [Phalaenopsis equestris]